MVIALVLPSASWVPLFETVIEYVRGVPGTSGTGQFWVGCGVSAGCGHGIVLLMVRSINPLAPTGNADAVEQLSVSSCSTMVLFGSMHARFGSTSEPVWAVTKNVPVICTDTSVWSLPGTRLPLQSRTLTGFCSN